MSTLEWLAQNYLIDREHRGDNYAQFQYELQTSDDPEETLRDFILAVIHAYRQR